MRLNIQNFKAPAHGSVDMNKYNPADNKWFSRVAIGSIIVETLKKMNIQMPVISEKEKALLQQAKEALEKE